MKGIFFTAAFFSSIAVADQPASARHATTDFLKNSAQLGIPYDSCVSLENKVGQLLFIFTDGKGANPRKVVHPLYVKAVGEMKIGGVRLDSENSARASIGMYQESIRALKEASAIPPFIGIDFANTDYIVPPVFDETEIQARTKTYFEKNKKVYLEAGISEEDIEKVSREQAITELEDQWNREQGRNPDDKYKGKSKFFGLGTYAGILGSMGNKERSCVSRAAYLDAFLHASLNVNLALGPTVDPGQRNKDKLPSWDFLSEAPREEVAARAAIITDTFHRFGIETSLKHFPYTPTHFNLHYMNEAAKDSSEDVKKFVEVFRESNQRSQEPSGMVMSTHLYNPNVDADLATVSEKWMKILREDVGFQGLIITDGLNMIGASKEFSAMLEDKWKRLGGVPFKNRNSTFSALAVLAGHDIVIIDDSLRITKDVFQDLLIVACQNTSLGQKLRDRVEESYARILTYKKKNAAKLTRANKASPALMAEALDLYTELTGNNSAACKDDERFERLKQKIEKTGLER